MVIITIQYTQIATCCNLLLIASRQIDFAPLESLASTTWPSVLIWNGIYLTLFAYKRREWLARNGNGKYRCCRIPGLVCWGSEWLTGLCFVEEFSELYRRNCIFPLEKPSWSLEWTESPVCVCLAAKNLPIHINVGHQPVTSDQSRKFLISAVSAASGQKSVHQQLHAATDIQSMVNC